MTEDSRSFIRVRGFRLACAQAKWDAENRLDTDLDILLRMLDDEKPTAVRQCLAALHKIVICKPNLGERILAGMDEMDLSKYKDSMAPLIEECAAKEGVPFKSIKIDSREKAQAAPAAWTIYALFYNGEYVTNEILSEKKFCAMIEKNREQG